MIPHLRPGDVLLFARQGFYNRIIQFKTWSVVSHVEIVVGPHETVASRNGQGVNQYVIDLSGLHSVLKPREPYDLGASMRWFATVQGQKYDWFGLLAFTSAKFQGKDNGRMFCSEFAARFLRAGGLDPFNGYDADGIAPSEFLKSPSFRKLEVKHEVAR